MSLRSDCLLGLSPSIHTSTAIRVASRYNCSLSLDEYRLLSTFPGVLSQKYGLLGISLPHFAEDCR